jgi:hypothetical protein
VSGQEEPLRTKGSGIVTQPGLGPAWGPAGGHAAQLALHAALKPEVDAQSLGEGKPELPVASFDAHVFGTQPVFPKARFGWPEGQKQRTRQENGTKSYL